MWASIATAVVDGLMKLAGYVAAFFTGELAQRSKDQAKVIDAAKTRVQMENEDSKLDDAAVIARLRAGK